MFGGGKQPNVSSDLPVLLNAYGIAYDPQKVVGDPDNATELQNPQTGEVLRYPTWLTLLGENFNAKSLPTAQLKKTVFVESGSLAQKPGSTLTFLPLIETSSQAGELEGMMLQMSQPDEIARQLARSGKKTIAALVTGKFKSAFPDGAPSEAPGKDAGAGLKPEDKKAEPAKAAGWFKESKTTSTLFVIADTDWLFDDFSVHKYNFFGQMAAEPFNDNLALAANTMEFLGGSPDLISIRGKGSSLRPFTVVRRMELEAHKKYQEKLTGLEARLAEVQKKLGEVQGKKTEGKRLIATPEVTKAIEDFQKQQAALRGERREIRRALREDIDTLENRLLIMNLLASPLLVGAFGIWFYRSRRN